MINAIDKTPRAPLWAVFGAPLIGVPLLVGLLALGAHRGDEVPSSEADAGYVTEQSEVETVELPYELPYDLSASREDALL